MKSKVVVKDSQDILVYACEKCKMGVFLENDGVLKPLLCNGVDCPITDDKPVIEINIVRKPCCVDVWVTGNVNA
jgi:hypothetical protein